MLVGELALVVQVDDERLKNEPQKLVLIQRVDDLKWLCGRYFHGVSTNSLSKFKHQLPSKRAQTVKKMDFLE